MTKIERVVTGYRFCLRNDALLTIVHRHAHRLVDDDKIGMFSNNLYGQTVKTLAKVPGRYRNLTHRWHREAFAAALYRMWFAQASYPIGPGQ